MNEMNNYNYYIKWVVLIIGILISSRNVEGLHKEYPEYVNVQVADDEIQTDHRTAFHFQPPKHWVNGTSYVLPFLSIHFDSIQFISFFLVFTLICTNTLLKLFILL
mgnify:CR=1 FL=1